MIYSDKRPQILDLSFEYCHIRKLLIIKGKWVATMKEIKSHKFAIHIKPFSYSDDSQYERIDIHPLY